LGFNDSAGQRFYDRLRMAGKAREVRSRGAVGAAAFGAAEVAP